MKKKILYAAICMCAVFLLFSCNQPAGSGDGSGDNGGNGGGIVTIPRGSPSLTTKPSGYSSTPVASINNVLGTWVCLFRGEVGGFTDYLAEPVEINQRMTYTFARNNWKAKLEYDIGPVVTQYVRENGGTKAQTWETIKVDFPIGEESYGENAIEACSAPNQYIIVYSTEFFNTDSFTPEYYYLSSDRKKLVEGSDNEWYIFTKQ